MYRFFLFVEKSFQPGKTIAELVSRLDKRGLGPKYIDRHTPRYALSRISTRAVKCRGAIPLMVFETAYVNDVVRRCTGLLSGLSHSRHALPRGTLITIVQLVSR